MTPSLLSVLCTNQATATTTTDIPTSCNNNIMLTANRFYDPDGGVVTLAGRDLSTYGARDISNTISWVTQEPQLFPISGMCARVRAAHVLM